MEWPNWLREMQRVLGGEVTGAPTVFREVPSDSAWPPRISTDSRTIASGELFWAIRGPRFDGNRFAESALKRGAAGVVVSESPPRFERGWVLKVPDTLAALHRWAAYRRSRFPGAVIAVTGSVGKTTTRQMIHTMLGHRFRGSASPGNWNNAIGLPLSIGRIQDDHQYTALEIGISSPGEMLPLGRLARPDVAVLTPMAKAHLSELGTLEGVIAEKTRLLECLSPEGEAIVAEDPRVEAIVAKRCRRMTVAGCSPHCDVRVDHVVCKPGELTFSYSGCRFSVPVWGRHHLPAITAALAVGRRFGVSPEEMAEALARFTPVPMRCEILDRGGVRVINDAYNANPASMRAALELLGQTPTSGRRIAVLGDMAELGPDAADDHFRVGFETVRFGRADLLFACGEQAETVIEGAKKTGLASDRGFAYDSLNTASESLAGTVKPGDLVLVKGSRMMQMERASESIPALLESRAA